MILVFSKTYAEWKKRICGRHLHSIAFWSIRVFSNYVKKLVELEYLKFERVRTRENVMLFRVAVQRT